MLHGGDSDVTFLMIGAEKRGISIVKATDTVAVGAGLKSRFPLMGTRLFAGRKKGTKRRCRRYRKEIAMLLRRNIIVITS